MTRLPLTIWALFFTAILGVLSFPVLLSGFILLLFDRNLGTSFYLSDIFISQTGQALPNEGGSAILFQHLFWFLGHPEVYIIILPCNGNGFGNAGSEFTQTHFWLYGHGGFIICNYYSCISCLGASHVCNRIKSIPRSIFVLLTLLIAVPSAIKVFNWLTTLWRGNIRFTPAMFLLLVL